mmetsp:Transcript_74886/g.243283  ORF Transcript_74886/g.243283 Transcript_74886/m.243283 type:complete len:118 (+) Transcript_74886:123-476(+)
MASLQGKIMQTVADEAAHKRMMNTKFADTVAAEDEVLFLGQDAYVPRLVAANVPIVKMSDQVMASGQDAIMYRPCYAEKSKGNRPVFQRGGAGGMPTLNTRHSAEPHVFPQSTVTGV